MSFFSSTIKSWNNLNPYYRKATSEAHFLNLLENLFSTNERLFRSNVQRRVQVALTQSWIFIEKM